MKIGIGRYKLILNPDSRLLPGSVFKLVCFIKKTKKVVAKKVSKKSKVKALKEEKPKLLKLVR